MKARQICSSRVVSTCLLSLPNWFLIFTCWDGKSCCPCSLRSAEPLLTVSALLYSPPSLWLPSCHFCCSSHSSAPLLAGSWCCGTSRMQHQQPAVLCMAWSLSLVTEISGRSCPKGLKRQKSNEKEPNMLILKSL